MGGRHFWIQGKCERAEGVRAQGGSHPCLPRKAPEGPGPLPCCGAAGPDPGGHGEGILRVCDKGEQSSWRVAPNFEGYMWERLTSWSTRSGKKRYSFWSCGSHIERKFTAGFRTDPLRTAFLDLLRITPSQSRRRNSDSSNQVWFKMIKLPTTHVEQHVAVFSS